MVLRLGDAIALYVCRHGETEANVEARFQGWTRDTPLTALGLAQGADIAKILARETGAEPALDFVSSPLPRARKTMELVRATLGLPVDAFRLDDRLREINLGSWDGLTEAEARALDPPTFDARDADKWDVRVPGGENYADVAARAADWAAGLRADTFAVTHGAFIRILRGLFLGLDGKGMAALGAPQGVVFRVRGSQVARLDP